MSLLKNIKLRGLVDILNPTKWKIFARYLKMKALKKEYEELSIPHYREQIILRMKTPECQPCIEKGECSHCGCKSPELFYDRNNYCSGGHWFEMMDDEYDWKEYLQAMGIEINEEDIKQLLTTGEVRL